MKYIKISRWEGTANRDNPDRPPVEYHLLGFYIQPYDNLMQAIDSEFLEENKNSYIQLNAIEMTEEEYNLLPKFKGY